jgi:CMP-N-acetylneuraminic acid synthetase
MKNINEVAIIIQARLSSKRIPEKMIKDFAGTTLTDIFLQKVRQCKAFPMENFYLSVCEPELVNIGKKHGVNIFHRSEESANSEGTPMSLMYEWWNKLPHTYGILINACVPFLRPETIDQFVEEYVSCPNDGMFAVMNKKNYFWNKDGSLITPLTEDVMNTKTVGVTYEAAHCLYAGRLDKIGKGIWMGDFNNTGEIKLFPIEEREALDIDYPWQFELCEKLWESK